MVVKSLVCVEEKIPSQPNAFELFGYDVIIDSNLRPWLLEVNSSPSMARGSPLDKRIKDAVIRDTINLVDPVSFDRAAVVEVLTRRLQQLKGKSILWMSKADPLLEADLHTILRGQIPRAYGEVPSSLGNFQRLCPGSILHTQVIRLKRIVARAGPSQSVKIW